jgi:cell division septation protein DedD
MRDAHRMKEKRELSLDNRHIGTLVLGGILLLGAVFVLGVVVGKRLSATQHETESLDLLTALDRKAKVMDAVHQDAPLTFQDELTKKEVPVREPPPAPVVKLEKPIPPEADVISRGDEVPSPTPAVRVEKVPEPRPEARVEIAKAIAIVKPDPVPTKVVATDMASSTRPATLASAGPSNGSGAFTLQLAASQNKDDADRQATRLRERGYAPYIVTAQVPGKGTWFRVRMGNFANKDAATHYLQDFHRETQLDAFVTATK